MFGNYYRWVKMPGDGQMYGLEMALNGLKLHEISGINHGKLLEMGRNSWKLLETARNNGKGPEMAGNG